MKDKKQEEEQRADDIELSRILGRMFIGHSLTDVQKLAKALAVTTRISKCDGQHYLLTSDFRPERINLEVVNNNVVETSNG